MTTVAAVSGSAFAAGRRVRVLAALGVNAGRVSKPRTVEVDLDAADGVGEARGEYERA